MMFLLGCETPPSKETDFLEKRKKEPISESFNVQYYFTENGIPKARMESAYIAEYYLSETEQNVTKVRNGLKLYFFDSSGKQNSYLSAQQADIYDARGYALASGKVVVVNQKGDKLETEQLSWQKKNNVIHTGKTVRITTDKEIIIGDSLYATNNFNNYQIYKVRGIFAIPEDN